ncbi:serine hydrolase [Flavobacterium sp. NRK1]|uniref:serine hydrolase domain-containing protein n=1 Tax=Flavobacterium sp. NRK1 TaxID=2954929 RepID=UPI00209331D1|nr:serine hydrolase domain-containing protein [Flavobacterium sp. NRK1]MCO6146674.1 beta-lactamase family protein [Flavobacterium sp. NRK1]
MKNKFALALACFFTILTVFAQAPDKTKLDQYFAALNANNKFMGSVAVSQNGKTVYSKSIGFADVEKGIKSNENTKFRIGSISKTFTSTLVLKAAEENKLKLTDKLEKYFPEIPNASKITIDNMLNHHSGIHNFTNDPEYMSYMTEPKTEAEMVAIIAKSPSDFEPDSKGEYSNSNYVLLSYIIEKVYKKPFKAIVDEKIIKPLGLKNTYYGSKTNTANNEAYSYSFDGKWTKGAETDMSIPMGAGAMISTPTDLSRFIEGLFAGKIISMASLEQMTTMKDNYGLGLFVFPLQSAKAYGHDGAIDKFTSAVVYIPQDKISIGVVSNGSNDYTNDDISKTLLDWIYKHPFEVPSFKTASYTTEELDKYIGNYTTTEIPIGIMITKQGTSLIAQATGQSSFPLSAAEENVFKFSKAGIVLEFDPAKNQMILKQGGGVFTFTKTN